MWGGGSSLSARRLRSEEQKTWNREGRGVEPEAFRACQGEPTPSAAAAGGEKVNTPIDALFSASPGSCERHVLCWGTHKKGGETEWLR